LQMCLFSGPCIHFLVAGSLAVMTSSHALAVVTLLAVAVIAVLQ